MDKKPIFRPSFGNRPDQFVGRDDVLGAILEGLQTYPGSAERATLLIGQRGMGKTALLLEVADRARDLGYVTARVTCGETMLDTIIDLLQRAGSEFVKEQKRPIKGFSAGALGFSMGLTFTEEARISFGFRVKLEMICERLGQAGKRVLLLIDEVDPSIEELRTLAKTYQELSGEEADISIVMAGLPGAISSTLNQRTLTFLNRAQRISLNTVPIPEVAAYYHSAFSRAGINADVPFEREAALATEGFPFLIQLIGYYLAKYSDPHRPVGKEELELAEEAASDELDLKVFQPILNPLSDIDAMFLQAMAEDDGPTKVSDLETRLGFSRSMVQTYRRRLLEAGVIVAPRRGELAFALPSLAGYLRRINQGE